MSPGVPEHSKVTTVDNSSQRIPEQLEESTRFLIETHEWQMLEEIQMLTTVIQSLHTVHTHRIIVPRPINMPKDYVSIKNYKKFKPDVAL